MLAGLHSDVNAMGPATVESPHSAGFDTGLTGAQALRGLLNFKTAADAMSLAHVQSNKLNQVLNVLKIRALEADQLVRDLQAEDFEGDAWQMASGPGFGRGPPDPDAVNSDLGELPIADLAGAAKSFAAFLQIAPAASRRNIGFASFVAGKEGVEYESADMDAYAITKQLRSVLSLSRKAVKEAGKLSNTLAVGMRSASRALRINAEMLNYPALPEGFLPGTPPVWYKPLKRPADLAPVWLDFLHASSTNARTDPYAGALDGYQGRLASGAEIPFRQVHNPFGSPPLDTHAAPSEAKATADAGGGSAIGSSLGRASTA